MAEQFYLKTVLHNGMIPIYFEIPIPEGVKNAIQFAPIKSAEFTFHSKDGFGVSIDPVDGKDKYLNIKLYNSIIPIVVEVLAPDEFIKAIKTAKIQGAEFEIYSKGKGGMFRNKPQYFGMSELADFRLL